MPQGIVELRSGRWIWTVREQQRGVAVVFRHRDRSHDELRTWAPSGALSPERARELALDPVQRLWRDADGLVWTIQAEMPSDWNRPPDGNERAIWLLFSAAGFRKRVAVPASSRLGELTHSELTRLLSEAFSLG